MAVNSPQYRISIDRERLVLVGGSAYVAGDAPGAPPGKGCATVTVQVSRVALPWLNARVEPRDGSAKTRYG